MRRGAQLPWCGIPVTAAQHRPFAINTGPRRTIQRRTFIIVMPAVTNPLRDIAMHLVQAPWIWFKRINGQSFPLNLSPRLEA